MSRLQGRSRDSGGELGEGLDKKRMVILGGAPLTNVWFTIIATKREEKDRPNLQEAMKKRKGKKNPFTGRNQNTGFVGSDGRPGA